MSPVFARLRAVGSVAHRSRISSVLQCRTDSSRAPAPRGFFPLPPCVPRSQPARRSWATPTRTTLRSTSIPGTVGAEGPSGSSASADDDRLVTLAPLPVVISPEERDALIQARSDVLALTEAADKMLNRCISAPVAGSEVESCLLKDPDGWWLMYSHSSLYVAIDHLTALVALWAAPAIPHSAGYTVTRGAAEAAARACWLAHPPRASL